MAMEQASDPTPDLPRPDALPAISGGERGSGGASDTETLTTLPARIDAQAERTPHATAVRFAGVDLTFEEVKRRSDRWAEELVGHGVRHGVVVPICMERCAGLVIGLVSILKAGGAYLPLDPDHPDARLEALLNDCGAHVVVVGARHAHRVAAEARTVVVLPPNGSSPEPSAAATRPAPPRPTDLAYVIYTSGSTGQPKGVMNEHAPVLNRLDWMIDAMQIGPTDCILQKTPASFDVSVWEFFIPLLCGARLVIAQPGEHLDPASLALTIAREGVTIVHFVPSMLSEFLEEPLAARCSSLRAVVASGEALLPAHVQRARDRLHCPLWNLYGPTEAAVDVTYHVCDPELDRELVPIGRPIRGARIYVVDAAGAPCAIGDPGELWIGGVPVARGYLGRDALTRERFLPDPFTQDPASRVYRTGDRARWRCDGELEYLGRLDDQVKIRGVRIEPAEIESALLGCAGVREAAVLVHDDPTRGAELVAYVAPLREGPQPEPRMLRASLAARLPSAFVPTQFVVLAALPRTTSGKIDRKALSPPVQASLRAVEPTTADDILRTWRTLLGAPHLGLDDDFLLAGGHSLLAIRIARALEVGLGQRVPVAWVMAARTPRALAERLATQPAERPSADLNAPQAGPWPLSPGQLALWLEHQMDGTDAAFHVPVAMRLVGPLDRDALRRALTTLVGRHETLRTRFRAVDPAPVQVVDVAPPLALDVRSAIDLSVEEIASALTGEARRPFDLETGPPYRALVLATGAAEHLLLLTFHHVAVDEWSIRILLEELSLLYRAEVAGIPANLPRPAFQMPVVAAWLHEQQARLGQEPWPEEWRGDPGLPPADLVLASPSGCRVVANLPESLGELLTRAATREGATPFELALSAFALLVRLLTHRSKNLIGTPRTARQDVRLADTVGYLLEMVPVCVQIEGSHTFREVLARVRESVRADPVPPAPTGTGRRPFEIVFVFLQDPTEVLRLDGITATPVPVWTGDPKYTLGVELILRGGQATCTIEFRRDLVSESVVEALIPRYAALLDWLLEHPEAPVADAPMLSDAEQEQALRDATGPQPQMPAAPSIHRWFEQRAAASPDSIAAAWGEQRLNYQTLDALANRLAKRLVAQGVRPGDRVPLLLSRTPRALAAPLAVLKAGAVYAPLDPEEPSERRARILEDLGSAVLLTERAIGSPAELKHLRRVLLDEPGLDEESAAPLDLDGTPDDPAYVMFTSGSTGRPKGVVVPHRGVLRLVHGQAFARMDESRTWLHLAPAWFDASTLEVWAALLHGGRCVVFPDVLPRFDDLACAIRDHQVDSLWLTSSLFNAIIDHDPNVLAGLTQLLVGGEALSPTHVRRAQEAHPDLRIVNGYGPTENTTFTTCHAITPADLQHGGRIPIGRPIAHTKAYVLDLDGRMAPTGVPGELWAAGMGVALGYLALPDETHERFVVDPWGAAAGDRLYRTGDLVRRMPDGTLDYLGRQDQQLKLRGFRIEPGEIEAALCRHPTVLAAAVDVVAIGTAGPALVCWFVVRPQAPAPTSGQLLAFLATQVPRHMVPAHLVRLDALPRTQSGKLDRRHLPRPDPAADHSLRAAYAPATDVERRLQDVWRAVLGLATVGLDDDFFALGGTSLLAIRLIERIERDLGYSLPARTVMTSPTIRALAEALREAPLPPRASAVVPLRRGSTGVPLLCLPGLGGHVFNYRTLLDRLRLDRPIFGLQVQEFDPQARVFDSIEALAAELIQQVRSVCPEGPYDLLGYSFGGTVAFEMARQLRAQGETEGRLILIDAYPAGAIRLRSGLPKLLVHLREMSGGGPRGVWQYLRERVAKRLGLGRTPAEREESGGVAALPARVLDVERRCLQALRRYRAGAFAGPLTLLRALRLSGWHFLDVRDPTCGWGALATARVRVRTLDCEHLEVFTPPHIEELARMIEEECRVRA